MISFLIFEKKLFVLAGGKTITSAQLIKTFNQIGENSPLVFEKYADGFDSNGFATDIVASSTPDVNNPGASVDKSDSPMEYNDVYFKMEFKKMAEQFCDLNSIFDYDYGQPVENSSLAGEGGSGPSVTADDMEMDTSYFKDNLLSAAKTAQKNKSINNNKNDNGKNNNSPNPEAGGVSKVNFSEDIDCIVESCCVLKRMNAFNDDFLVEIVDIIPTNSYCNQLLVKLVKTAMPNLNTTNRIIMATLGLNHANDSDNDNDDEHDNDYDEDINVRATNQSQSVSKKSVGGQLLLFDCIDGVIPNEYKKSITFSRAKCPKEICILPNFQQSSVILDTTIMQENEKMLDSSLQTGAFCVVCADGSIELYSLCDFQRISSIKEEEHHFISATYCRSLERLCCCTKAGALIFYSLNDTDNESGDEMIDMEEENCTGGGITLNDNAIELCVTDGATPNSQEQQRSNAAHSSLDEESSESNQMHLAFNTNIKIDCGLQRPYSSQSGATLQLSPSPSSMSNNAAASNLLAYRTGDLSLDDLRAMYALTIFDDKPICYTAEVPSCWLNSQLQAQKQRKQSQHTWRLHNDA